jgi:hypothetical protein
MLWRLKWQVPKRGPNPYDRRLAGIAVKRRMCRVGLLGWSVAGALRAVPCGALPRRERPRTPPRLAGVESDPSPRSGRYKTSAFVTHIAHNPSYERCALSGRLCRGCRDEVALRRVNRRKRRHQP